MSLGFESFVWFIGKVEDIEDPLKLGRARVRILNIHNKSTSLVPKEKLPWALILNTPLSASYNKIGISPVGIDKDTTVVGFFLDGSECNQPIILGTLSGTDLQDENKNDLPPEARGIDEVKKDQIGPEPKSSFKSKYPFNRVLRTKAGHVIEIDDTPDHERIHIFHTKGSYIEINKDGDTVQKVIGQGYQIYNKDNKVYLKGKLDVEAEGAVTILAKGDLKLQSDGKIDMIAGGEINIQGSKINLN